jgi:3-phenylpropionate/cinnamic acid dioxygenase small subunit
VAPGDGGRGGDPGVTVTAVGIEIGADLYTDILQFLYREARLLDEHRFEDWVELLTDDVVYEMPLTLTRERAEQDRVYDREMEYFAENRESLQMRIARLRTEYAWAEDPPTRTRHLVHNVELERLDDGRLLARSAFVVHTNRANSTAWESFVGRREDVLVHADAGWKIARRTLFLDQAVLGIKSISIFL